jgi:predicted RND superfamily exporter protein
MFVSLARLGLARGRRLWAIAFALAVVSAWIGLPPKIDSNLLNLLPDDDRIVQALRRINEEEGGLSVLTLTFEADDPEALDPFLDALTADFLALPEVAFALHEVDPALATQIGLYQLEPQELRALDLRLQGALALGPALNPMLAQPLLDMGPTTDKIAKLSQGGMLGGEANRAKLIVRPTQGVSDPKFTAAFMADVDRLLKEADAPGHGVRLSWIGGAYRHTHEDVVGIQRDLGSTTSVSALLVLLVLAVAFRSWRAPFLLFPPLVIANLVNLAFVALAIGSLNTYTSLGTAILFGLGIEFSVHLVSRYREQRAAGLTLEEAVEEAWGSTAPPSLTSALASSAGFLSLVIARFEGFSQLGIVLAVGLMLSFVAVVLLLPSLIGWLDKNPPAPRLLRQDDGPRATRYAWAPAGFAAYAVITVIAAAVFLPRVSFEYDLSELRRDGMAYDELSEAEQRAARESYSPVVVTYRGPSGAAEASADRARLEAAIDGGTLPHIGRVLSMEQALPPDQAERLPLVAAIVTDAEHPSLRYLPTPVAKALAPLAGLKVRTLSREDLPPGLRHMLGGGSETVHRLLLLPKGNMWDGREAEALAEELAAVLPEDREVAGEHIGVAHLMQLGFEDMRPIVLVASVLVALVTYVDLGTLVATLGALFAFVAGVVWTFVLMSLLDVRLSLVNLTGIPILLGIGVDVVVHLTHRLRELGPGRIGTALRTTGVAVVVCTATNIASFGSLAMAGNRGVRSLGFLALLGMVFITVVGTTMLPLLWATIWRREAASSSS